MTLARLTGLTLALTTLGCVVDTKSLDDGGSGNDGSGTSAGTTTGDLSASGATTSGAVTSAGDVNDEGTSVGPTTAGGDTSQTTDASTSSATGETTSDTTGGGDSPMLDCDFVEVTAELAEQSKSEPFDCGVATLADDLETWQAVHQCALSRASSQESFKSVFELQGLDSTLYRGYVGQVGAAYGLSELNQDLLGAADAPVHRDGCMGLMYLSDCQVGVGFSCILCLADGGTGDTVCEPG